MVTSSDVSLLADSCCAHKEVENQKKLSHFSYSLPETTTMLASYLTLLLALASVSLAQVPIQTPDGIFVGSFKNYIHDIKGEVFVIDDKTLLVKVSFNKKSSKDSFTLHYVTKPYDVRHMTV